MRIPDDDSTTESEANPTSATDPGAILAGHADEYLKEVPDDREVPKVNAPAEDDGTFPGSISEVVRRGTVRSYLPVPMPAESAASLGLCPLLMNLLRRKDSGLQCLVGNDPLHYSRQERPLLRREERWARRKVQLKRCPRHPWLTRPGATFAVTSSLTSAGLRSRRRFIL
jgi:hypothetical protein